MRRNLYQLLLVTFVSSFFWNCATTTIHTGTGDLYSKDGRKDEESYFDPASKRDAALRGETCPCKNETPSAQADPRSTAENTTDKKVAERSAPGYEPKEEESYFNQTKPDKVTPTAEKPAIDPNADETGTASWYGRDFDGKPTANGDVFDSRKLTAAHKTLPLGTIVLVKNLENNRETLVTVNDRGPFVRGRVLDLSEYGAEVLGYKERGLTTVSIKVVRRGDTAVKEKGPGATAGVFTDAQNTAVGNGPEQVKPAVVQRTKVAAPASVPDEKSLQKYSVQVGLYADYDNADKMGKYLGSYGHPVHIFQRGSSFVVKVGEFKDRASADQLKIKLSSDGYTAFISAP